jgi:hypothetical protein
MLAPDQKSFILNVDAGIIGASFAMMALFFLRGTFFPSAKEQEYDDHHPREENIHSHHFNRLTILLPWLHGEKGPLALLVLRGYVFLFTWTVLLYDVIANRALYNPSNPNHSSYMPWFIYLTHVSYFLLAVYFTAVTFYGLKFGAYEDKSKLLKMDKVKMYDVKWYDKALWVLFELVWSSALLVVLGFWGKSVIPLML